MKRNEIRINYPAPNEFGNSITVDPSNHEVVATFFGEQHGVRLVKRGRNDPHICFEILSEDDGHWYVSCGGSYASSYWMPGLLKVMRFAQKWMKRNCLDDVGKNGHWWGYKAR